MTLGICTIQRNRGPWLIEWFAFHYLVGFRNFYFFAHKCTDDTLQIIAHLQRWLNIKVAEVGDDVNRPQLTAYQYAYDNYNHEVDWMAFIDGDEFLFSPNFENLEDCLSRLDNGQISAFAVYWACFGSSRFLIEPVGLITENYRYRAPISFPKNSHIKSIVRGKLGNAVSVSNNAHIFCTPNGTVDENYQLVTSGNTSFQPTWNNLRINHYICQSRTYFSSFKQSSGAADVNPRAVRPEWWWLEQDRNDEFDSSLAPLYPNLRKLMLELCQ